MADHPHVTYTVTHQQQQTEPDERGHFHDVMHVHYHTASGTHAKVKVPMHQYTARNVHEFIHADAQEIERVNALQHGTPVPPQTGQQ